jgi:ribonuclease J
VKPNFFIPIHGELRHLHQHSTIAQQIGVPQENIAIIENGQVVEFQNGEMRLAERIKGGWVFVDGYGVGDVGPSVIREREALARDGFVLINLTLDRYSHRLLDDPEIITRGFIYTRNGGEDLLDETRNLVRQTVSSGTASIEDDIQETVKSFLFNKTRRRPMIFVSLTHA